MTLEEFWEKYFEENSQKDIQDLIQQLDEYLEEIKDAPFEPEKRCEDCLFIDSKDICLFCQFTKYEFENPKERESLPILFRRHEHYRKD